jgi:hypothetical protein
MSGSPEADFGIGHRLTQTVNIARQNEDSAAWLIAIGVTVYFMVRPGRSTTQRGGGADRLRWLRRFLSS